MKVKASLFIMLLLLSGCQSKPKDTYVDFKGWSEGRVCDKLLWKCLPESNDTKRWQKPLENGIDTLELNKETLSKSERIGREWERRYDEYHAKPHKQGEKEPMLVSALDKKFLQRVAAKQFLVDMEQDLGKEFPGFWRDTPKKVRYRWIQRAMNKAKRFGSDPKQNKPMIELCARIGLDFDKDPKWDYIVKFIEEDPQNHVVYAIRYLDWTLFDKTHDYGGTKITDWSMGRAIGKLPYPKKPYPRLND